MRIKFLRDELYENAGRHKGVWFREGQVLDARGVQRALGLAEVPEPPWSAAFLQRWVTRGTAEEVDGRTPLTPAGLEAVQVAEAEAAAKAKASADKVAAERAAAERVAAEKAAATERSHWELFDDYNARNATAAFSEIEWE